MLLYPAIDILEGRAVRLTQGHFEDRTVYHDDPLDAARAWAAAGARALHVVDLDGARSGTPAHVGTLARIVAETGLPVQTGGGLRDAGAVAAALAAGVRRVVIGTAAYRDPDFLAAIVAEHGPERVAVAVDVRDGRVSGAGWTQDTGMTAPETIERLRGHGARTFIYTDVDRDGMLAGIDLDDARRLADVVGQDGALVWSGGVGALSDLEGLARLGLANLDGVIVGKALFERRFDVAAGQAALDGGA